MAIVAEKKHRGAHLHFARWHAHLREHLGEQGVDRSVVTTSVFFNRLLGLEAQLTKGKTGDRPLSVVGDHYCR